MKPYRPKYPDRKTITQQTRSRGAGQPYCFGHHHARAIICRPCVWSDDCVADRRARCVNDQPPAGDAAAV